MLFFNTDKAVILFKAFLDDVPEINFDSKNTHFKNEYISLPGLLDILEPVLKKHNAMLLTPITAVPEDGGNILNVMFIFTDGDEYHTYHSSIAFPILDNPQHTGSQLTYLRRYGILSALNKAPDSDDDAQAIQTQQIKSSTRRSIR